jgi:hypothetical protein
VHLVVSQAQLGACEGRYYYGRGPVLAAKVEIRPVWRMYSILGDDIRDAKVFYKNIRNPGCWALEKELDSEPAPPRLVFIGIMSCGRVSLRSPGSSLFQINLSICGGSYLLP